VVLTQHESKEIEERIGSDQEFERQWSRVQRTFWALLVLFLIAGLSGLFGRGPLSKAKAGPEAGMLVEYERFARWKTPSRIKVFTGDSSPEAHEIQIVLSSDLAQTLRLEQTVPRPTRTEMRGDHIALLFGVTKPGESVIQLTQEPSRPGRLVSQILGPEGQEVTFSQFVYP
jgi:hypothetical protein